MLGILAIFVPLVMVLLFLTWLLVSKKKGKKCSQAVNEGPKALEAIYEDPDAVLDDNFQPSFSQDKEVITADNVPYSTELQVLQDKAVKTEDNLAYNVVSTL